MSSIWNLTSGLRTGFLKIAPAGRELYGTVVKSGVNKKTVTVRVNRFFFVKKYNKTYSWARSFQVHDEEEYCVLGDKVIIRSCRPMSKTKRYYVRNIVVMMPRPFTGQKIQGTIEVNEEPKTEEPEIAEETSQVKEEAKE
ncbi:unnamed protein product [Blepharisma stoltei]|uniref:30S ribosomal protein S17, chloroplastic n=1 Tax=Blepharisma stoltei TaxID=1481888 RepID=A0AAU9JU70_9CILI|nr:unnamed protein product [Blepharisma stoltei]